MVQACLAAEKAVVDTGFVKLERQVTGVDGNGDRPHCSHGRLQIGFTSRLDVRESGVGRSNIGRVVTACIVLKGNELHKNSVK